MFVNSMPRYEILSEDAMDVIDRGWRRLVSEIGIEFLLPEAVDLLVKAGQTLEDENRIRFDPEFILEQVAKAPARVRPPGPQPGQHRRTSAATTWCSRRSTAAPFIREGDTRRDAKMADFENLVKLSQTFDRARLAGRHDLRARGPPARLAPPRHGVRAPDPVGQAVHGLGDQRPERGGHDKDGRDPVRRPRGARARPGVDQPDQRQLAAALRRPHAGRDGRVREGRPGRGDHARSCSWARCRRCRCRPRSCSRWPRRSPGSRWPS